MNPEEQGPQNSETHIETSSDDINPKMELERGLIEFGCKYLHISENEWIKHYAGPFDQVYHDPHLAIQEKFYSKDVYDKNPEEFYRYVHQLLFEQVKQQGK